MKMEVDRAEKVLSAACVARGIDDNGIQFRDVKRRPQSSKIRRLIYKFEFEFSYPAFAI